MSAPTGNYVVLPGSSNGTWQQGTTSWNQNWQRGTTGYPTSSVYGSNRAPNVTDPRADKAFICIKQPDLAADKPWLSHHQQFLFRILDPSQDEQVSFESWRRKLVDHSAPTLPTRSKSAADRLYNTKNGAVTTYDALMGFAPFCVMVTVPELNYRLAKAQMEDGLSLRAVQLFQLIRPLGVSTTAESTAEYTDSGAVGHLRNLTIQGPARMSNILGKEAKEGEVVYAKLVARPAERMKFIINKEGKTMVVNNTYTRISRTAEFNAAQINAGKAPMQRGAQDFAQYFPGVTTLLAATAKSIDLSTLIRIPPFVAPVVPPLPGSSSSSTTTVTVKEEPRKMIWLIELTTDGDSPNDQLELDDGSIDVGWKMRLGVIQHVYMANLLPKIMSTKPMGHDAQYPQHDLAAIYYAPTIRFFVDYIANAPY
jgi:hypothetical protein